MNGCVKEKTLYQICNVHMYLLISLAHYINDVKISKYVAYSIEMRRPNQIKHTIINNSDFLSN